MGKVADQRGDTVGMPAVDLLFHALHLSGESIHAYVVELRFEAMKRCRKRFPILCFAKPRKCGYLAGYLRFEDVHKAVDQLLVAAHEVMEQRKVHHDAAPGLKMSL